MNAQVQAYPAAEKLVYEILSAAYDGEGYYIAPVIPDTLSTVTITVQNISGSPLNIWVDKPVLELSSITSKHISGDAGYGVADALCHDFWVQLFNARGLQFENGVVTAVEVVSDPHRIVDVNVDTYRFATTVRLTVHA